MHARAFLDAPAKDITWFHASGDLPVHAPSVLDTYVEGGPPLLVGESNHDRSDAVRLWYSHSTNQSWEGSSGIVRRITHLPKNVAPVDTGTVIKRQDDTVSNTEGNLSGAYVFNEGDATTEYNVQTDSNIGNDIAEEMADQNGQDPNGKFVDGGVYCMNIDSDTRATPLATTGYMWYFDDPR